MKVSLAVKLNQSELIDMPFLPQPPKNMDDLDIPSALVEDLILLHSGATVKGNVAERRQAQSHRSKGFGL